MGNDFKPLVFALKKEVLRLEKIATRLEKAHFIHLKSVQDVIRTINGYIKKLNTGRI